ncbi:MAG: DUF4382 domain-containing protein [archaeon]|nr:DUF4382 domain-containing protein [archaeon]
MIKKILIFTILALFISGCTTPQGGEAPATGTLILLISDEDADIADFSSVEITISSARVFKSDSNSGFEQFEVNKAVDLTELTGERAIPVLETELDAGTYSKIELTVGSVSALLLDGQTAEVNVPSGKLQIIRPFTIDANSSTRFVFDIHIVKAGNTGKYNLSPVIAKSGVVGKDVPQTQEPNEAEESDENEPSVSPESEITEGSGTARLVSTLSATSGGTISFAKPDEPGSQGKGNDENSTKGKPEGTGDMAGDVNKTKENGKPNEFDLNAITAINITVGEVSVHLSRIANRIGDANSVDDTNTIGDDSNDDTNSTLGDSNSTNQDTNSADGDVNSTILDQNLVVDENSMDDINANFAQDENKVRERNKWLVVSSTERTFNLLELATTESILSDSEIPAGQYTQIRMQILSAEVIVDGNSFEVTVPPSKLILHGVFDAGDGEEIYLNLDFDAEKSLKQNGKGEFSLRPTIRLRIIEETEIGIEDGNVMVSGGNLTTDLEQESA